MKEITYRKKRKKAGKIIGVLAGLLVLAALVVFGLFRVREVAVTGNSIYSAADIQNAVMQDGLCKNTLYLMWKYRDDSRVQEDLPFLSSVEVTMLTPYQVQIEVHEKAEVGYFLNGTDYVYFDRDGLIVEISKKLRENIPKVTGITIAKPVQYELLPIKEKEPDKEGEEETEGTEETEGSGSTDISDSDLFDAVVEITQVLSKNALVPKEIRFDDQQEVTLCFERMRVKLGVCVNVVDKITALKSVYEKVEGMEGTLHMESYSEDAKTITFKQGETEESLEIEEPEKSGDDISREAGSGEETESETEKSSPVYSESDGNFSTDAEGNRIYTDAAGNTTPNVEEYQYTDENGEIITDGYGYIDPYTGAYILK